MCVFQTDSKDPDIVFKYILIVFSQTHQEYTIHHDGLWLTCKVGGFEGGGGGGGRNHHINELHQYNGHSKLSPGHTEKKKDLCLLLLVYLCSDSFCEL